MSVRPKVLAKKEGKKHTLQFFLIYFFIVFYCVTSGHSYSEYDQLNHYNILPSPIYLNGKNSEISKSTCHTHI